MEQENSLYRTVLVGVGPPNGAEKSVYWTRSSHSGLVPLFKKNNKAIPGNATTVTGHARETETVLSEAVVLGPRLSPAGPAAAGFLRGEDGGLVTNHT